MKAPELGCYGDGSLGHQHTRERCAEMILDVASGLDGDYYYEGIALVSQLRGPMSDDASEEDEACGWLTDHCSQANAWWGWQDGDFGLWAIEDSEA